MALQPFGTIKELWRYPVSSVAGEKMEVLEVTASGVTGDRLLCLVDTGNGQPAAPEKEPRWRPALFLSSRLRNDTAELGFPDGHSMAVTHPLIHNRLDHHFGFPVSVRRYESNHDPNYGKLDFAVNRYAPSPVNLLSTSTLNQLSRLVPGAEIDSRRFRPTLLVETDQSQGFVEHQLLGRVLLFNNLAIRIVEETKRCGMTMIAQPGLKEEPEILRNIVRSNRRNLGVYCSPETAGTMSVGDCIFVKSEKDC